MLFQFLLYFFTFLYPGPSGERPSRSIVLFLTFSVSLSKWRIILVLFAFLYPVQTGKSPKTQSIVKSVSRFTLVSGEGRNSYWYAFSLIWGTVVDEAIDNIYFILIWISIINSAPPHTHTPRLATPLIFDSLFKFWISTYFLLTWYYIRNVLKISVKKTFYTWI